MKDSMPPPESVPIWSPLTVPTHQVLSFCNERTIAEQMTLIDIELFRRLERTELVGLKWMQQKYNLLTPHVRALLDRHEQVSCWVQTWTLLQPTFNDRKKVIQKLFNISKILLEMHNFYSFMAIFTGLNAQSMQKLKHTWSSLGKKTIEMLDLYNKLSSPNISYIDLREKLKDNGKNRLPFLTVCLNDLRHLEETQADFESLIIDSDGKETQFVNFKKYSSITETMNSLFPCQKTLNMEIEKKDPYYTFLVCLPVLNEEYLAQKSQELDGL